MSVPTSCEPFGIGDKVCAKELFSEAVRLKLRQPGDLEKREKPMNVYDRLLQDHRECRNLFAKLDEPEELAAFGRRQFYEDLRLKLVAHDKAEEETYYGAIEADQSVHGLVEDGRHDHHELTRLLDRVRDQPVEDEAWLCCMREIREKFLRHAAEEEQKMIPRSRQVLSETRAEEVGKQFQNRELRILMAERRHSQ